jgi:hypothetical protein
MSTKNKNVVSDELYRKIKNLILTDFVSGAIDANTKPREAQKLRAEYGEGSASQFTYHRRYTQEKE